MKIKIPARKPKTTVSQPLDKIVFWMPKKLKVDYKTYITSQGLNMSEDLTAYIKSVLAKNRAK